LRGNKISKLSGLGISELPRLAVLDVAQNFIKTLEPLGACENLEYLDVRDNQIDMIRQVEFLSRLQFLQHLYFLGNPCSLKPFYRSKI
jgi:Leucine-rich repeat (LRR) protein